MFSGEIYVLLRHPVSDGFHIACSIRHTDLEIAIAAIASKIVVAPLRGQKAERLTAFAIVSWQPRVVGLKKVLKPLVANFASQSANGGRDMRRAVAKGIEEQNVATIGLLEGMEAHAFQAPFLRIAPSRVRR